MTNPPNSEFSADPPEIDPAELSRSITELRLRITKMYEQAIARQQNRDGNDFEAPYQQAERDGARMQQMIEKITQDKIIEKARIDQIDQACKTTRLLVWCSFILIFCASITVILTVALKP